VVDRGYTLDMIPRSDVKSSLDLLKYGQQTLGTRMPIGSKRRSLACERINLEMAAQRWTMDHLLAAVDYMKARGIQANSFDFVFYHVEPAVKDGFMPRQHNKWEDLDAAVAEAVAKETDESWLRKLVMARGIARQKVYEKWSHERLPQLEGS